MKEVAQRCWACWVAQRASKRPNKLKGGILDSSMVCSLIPDLWGDGAKEAREEKKNDVASWLAQECYRVHSEEAKRLLKKDFKKKLAELFEKLAPPWE